MNDGRFRLNEPQVTAKVMDGEAVIIHLGTGIYYSMDGVGCLVWEGIAAGNDADTIIEGIASRYGVDRDLAQADVSRLIGELVAQELVVPSAAAPSAATAGAAQVAPATYTAPVLNRYEDMADLLALDPPLPAAPR